MEWLCTPVRQSWRCAQDPFDFAQGRFFGTEIPQDDSGKGCWFELSPLALTRLRVLRAAVINSNFP